MSLPCTSTLLLPCHINGKIDEGRLREADELGPGPEVPGVSHVLLEKFGRLSMKLSMTRTGARLVALLAAGCVRVMMPPAVTEPLSQPATESPMVWQYAANSITLNDCHISRLGQPLAFTSTQLGAIPLTTLAATSTSARRSVRTPRAGEQSR